MIDQEVFSGGFWDVGVKKEATAFSGRVLSTDSMIYIYMTAYL